MFWKAFLKENNHYLFSSKNTLPPHSVWNQVLFSKNILNIFRELLQSLQLNEISVTAWASDLVRDIAHWTARQVIYVNESRIVIVPKSDDALDVFPHFEDPIVIMIKFVLNGYCFRDCFAYHILRRSLNVILIVADRPGSRCLISQIFNFIWLKSLIQ